METHLFDRGAMENRNQSYTLKNNKIDGLKTAVNNGQVRLALEYSQAIIVELAERIVELENKVGTSDSVVATNAENLPAVKKTAKTNRAAAKTGEEDSVEA